VSVEIRLLGRPCAWRDGVKVELRGHKAWLLLATLLLEDAPVGRGRLARMLFVDAADPAASLRWNLSQLRRHLGIGMDGDPVALEVPPDVSIDADLLLHGDAEDAAVLPCLDEELLAGLRTDAASEHVVWLEDERRRIHQLGVDVRQEAALTRLGRGDTDAAVALARQVAEASPLDENASALLVRCLRAAGRIADARMVAERAASRLRDELGVEPTDLLWAAAAAPPGGDRRVTGRGAVIAQLEAGASAVTAGAADAGIAALRSAIVAARAIREPTLLARALVALGSAMIHGVRGADQEGLALLHEAIPLTETIDDGALAVTARSEIGYVDFLRGRYDRAFHWFDQARLIGDGATTEVGWVDLYAGSSRDDVGASSDAARLLDRALRTAQSARDLRLEAFALTMLGRHHLMQDDLDESERTLDTALQIVNSLDWTAFRSFPEAILSDVVRRRGDLGRARGLAEHAFVLGEQVGDPCWESAALRSLGLVTVDAGDVGQGVALLRDAPAQCRRLPDTYRWIELWGLDALVDVARHQGLRQAHAWAEQLGSQASAHGMRPFAQRARRPSAV
jgi:DNA-binding SARP family transcriptional activator